MQKAAEIKKKLSDYARQEMVNLQAAKAGASISGDLPVNMGREAEVNEISAPVAKIGKVSEDNAMRKLAGKKVNPGFDVSSVKGYEDLQRIMAGNNKSYGLLPGKK